MEEGAGDLQTPLHAAGEGTHLGIAAITELDIAQPGVDFGFAIANVVHPPVKLEVFPNAEIVIEADLLDNHANGTADSQRIGCDIVAHDLHGAFGGGGEGCKHPHRSRFTGAVRAKEAEHFAARDREGEVFDNCSFTKALVDPNQLDRSGSHAGVGRRNECCHDTVNKHPIFRIEPNDPLFFGLSAVRRSYSWIPFLLLLMWVLTRSIW